MSHLASAGRARRASASPSIPAPLAHPCDPGAAGGGVHVKIVSERLGHSSVMITLDNYSHAIPGLQRDAAEKVAALIPGLGP